MRKGSFYARIQRHTWRNITHVGNSKPCNTEMYETIMNVSFPLKLWIFPVQLEVSVTTNNV